MQATIIMVCSWKSRRSNVSAALYSNAVAMTALVRNPVQGAKPVLKYDSPLITLKMPSWGTTVCRIAMTHAMPPADQQRPPDVAELGRQKRRQAEDCPAGDEHADAVHERVDDG